ncbi:MAG: hypothetical protein HDR06_11460 [Lachnospiraceae bacterium]|nr:hypothetical protein [Lachnospiraceae bacterium]
MNKKLCIVSEMERLAKIISHIENGLDEINKTDVEFLDNIRIQYIIPNDQNYSGNGVRAMIRDVAFPTPDRKFADKIISCIRQKYEEELRECYEMMEKYAEKLKNAP